MSDVSQGPGWWQASDGKWYPPQPPAVAPVPPKKKFYTRVWFWLLVVVALGFGGCITVLSSAATAVNNANNKQHTVVYSVTGTGTPDIVYYAFDNGHSGSSQVSSVALPWTKTVTGSGLFNSFSVDATLGVSGGSVSCSLTVDGKVVSTNSASGALASADCTGSAS